MPDLTTELNELESTLADANNRLVALSGDSSQEHRTAVGLIIAAMERARLSANARRLALKAQGAAATAAIDGYFDGIAPVREAMIADGDLSSSAQDDLREQLQTALQLNNADELDTLLAEVQAYDDVGSDTVKDARTALVDAEAALATAGQDLEVEQAALNAANQTATTLAARAAANSTLAYQQRAGLEVAITAGRLHQAVVHLQDLTNTRNALNAAISLAPPGFDADNTNTTAVTSNLTTEWTSGRDSYEQALATLVDSQETAFEQRLALAAAEADAQDRAARRLIDAAQQVADKKATL
jgi:hypothetical protein